MTTMFEIFLYPDIKNIWLREQVLQCEEIGKWKESF